MLVLTRKLDEAIQIGDNIKITVLRVKGNTVRIGIEAPKSVRVIRDELEREIIADRVSAPSLHKPTNRIESYVGETNNVVTAIVDSPEPSTARMFVGKVSAQNGKTELTETQSDPSDQAAPLRAFLKTARPLQIAS